MTLLGNSAFIMSISLGGCLKAPPIDFGLTEDTGGHIAYVLGAAAALSRRKDVHRVEIVTRLIEDSSIGSQYAVAEEQVSPKLLIRRLPTGDRRYLAKEAIAGDRPDFVRALLHHLARSRRKPDLIHAHFADAAVVAAAVRKRFGIPFVYTAHSLAMEKAAATGGGGTVADRIAEELDVIGEADAIVASSRDEAERQLMRYASARPARIHCIPPGAAVEGRSNSGPEAARRLVAPFLRDPSKPMILAIARPVAKKNLAGLVELYAADGSLRDRANLVVVAGLRSGPDHGEPEQRAVIGDLLRALDRHDLYGSLALPKRHRQEDVPALYDLARETGGVFVNPAFTEPYGLTLTEAATYGLPVVATCHGGAGDIVRTLGHGCTADPRDAPAFAAAIRSLIEDSSLWRTASQNGRVRGGGMTWDGYAERFMRLAATLTGQATSRASAGRPSRLLLCDIDNTITGCRPGAEELVRYLEREDTLAFGVATGRSLQEAIRLLDAWGLPEPRLLITSVGSEIYWRESGGLTPDDAFLAHIDHAWAPAEVEARVVEIAGVVPQPPVEQRRFKRSYFIDRPSLVEDVRQAVADLPVRVIHSHERLLDILPERAGKGAAMTWAARRLGLPPEHVYAAGDSGNDLDMLAACRNSILVANHSPDLAPLLHLPTAYVARRAHAGGIVEGMRAYAERLSA